MKQISAREIEKIYDEGVPLYVRWSRGPRYDKKPSRDYVSGSAHSGISAVKIGYWADEYLIRRLDEYSFLRIKDKKINAYIYTGEECGQDSDGYELLTPSSVVCIGRWDEKKI